MLSLVISPVFAQTASTSAASSHRIGVLTDLNWTDPNAAGFLKAFTEHLQALGYMAGRDFLLELRAADRNANLLANHAVELAKRSTVIVTASSSAGKAAHEATKSIPIVGCGSDSVMGGNMTGFSGVAEHQGEFLAQLKAVIPELKRVALLFDRSYFAVPPLISSSERAAEKLGLALIHAEVNGVSDWASQFAQLKRSGAQAVLALNHPDFRRERSRLTALAIEHGLPLSSPYRENAEAGALLAHSQDFRWIGASVAGYVDRLLKGARISELPVNRDAPFQLFVNLRTARVLGVTVPDSLLQQASGVFGR
ncbi:MAG: ABC transporter substrate-binding protein [Bryobacterales bacterium]|nr:ABC transporter substrate-binding protein [Bryobacterales bacterium]